MGVQDARRLAVTSYGYTDNCRYMGGYQRVEIQVGREWLPLSLNFLTKQALPAPSQAAGKSRFWSV